MDNWKWLTYVWDHHAIIQTKNQYTLQMDNGSKIYQNQLKISICFKLSEHNSLSALYIGLLYMINNFLISLSFL